MPEIINNKLVLNNGECELGNCPICMSDSLDYESYEVVDSCILYPWTCQTCGAAGSEVGIIEFGGYEVNLDYLEPQIESLYCDGGLRPESDIDIPREKQKKKRDNGAR